MGRSATRPATISLIDLIDPHIPAAHVREGIEGTDDCGFCVMPHYCSLCARRDPGSRDGEADCAHKQALARVAAAFRAGLLKASVTLTEVEAV